MRALRFIKISLVLMTVYAVISLLVMHSVFCVPPDSKKALQELSKIHDRMEEEQEEQNYDTFAQVLLEANPESAGWLAIDGTPVDYPVVLAENNDVYLKLDYLGGASNLGTLFFDYECRLEDDACRNLIIYGHTTSSGLMFGSLKYYREIDYFNKHREIILYRIGEGERKFTVFSVFVTSAYPDESTQFMDYRQIYFAGDWEYEAWLAYFQNQSMHSAGQQLDPSKQVLTLSTCAYDFSDARLVVMAIEL